MKSRLASRTSEDEYPIKLPCLLLHKPTGCVVFVTECKGSIDQRYNIYSGFCVNIPPDGSHKLGDYWSGLTLSAYERYHGTVTLEND